MSRFLNLSTEVSYYPAFDPPIASKVHLLRANKGYYDRWNVPHARLPGGIENSMAMGSGRDKWGRVSLRDIVGGASSGIPIAFSDTALRTVSGFRVSF